MRQRRGQSQRRVYKSPLCASHTLNERCENEKCGGGCVDIVRDAGESAHDGGEADFAEDECAGGV